MSHCAPGAAPAAAAGTVPSEDVVRVVLVGSPNSGKTTLFNALTGLRAKTGNYPGVTVDRRVGCLRTRVEGREVQVCDLPGLYSLRPISEDEEVAVRVLRGEQEGEPPPDAVVFVADATNLERSLGMLAEVLALGRPTLLALTMVDELKARGGEVDVFRLQQALGIPVVGVVGHRGLGIGDLMDRLARPEDWRRPGESSAALPPPPPEAGPAARTGWADEVLRHARRRAPEPSRWTRRLDAVLLHPVAGLVVFLLFVTTFFQAIFSWAAPAMDAMVAAVDGLADWMLATLPPGTVTSLLADGLVRGVGNVIVFVPQIALLFAMIFFFEASGYMARAAFVVDRVMGWAGLEGRAFIALLSSYACAVPGIMATRTIPSPRDRLATILVAPFATCSARLPVYALLITAFVPGERVFGWWTLQGLTLFGLYVLGGVSAVLFAALFKRGLLRGAQLPFYLELPPYRWPSLRSVLLQTWGRVRIFLRDAGTVILTGSLILWALLHFPRVDAGDYPSQREAAAAQLEQSVAADLGRAMEPVFGPLGFDWRVNVGLIGSFAARELMVSTLAQVYAHEGEDTDTLAEVLAAPDPETGRPRLSRASAFALLAFYVYALLCLSTVAVARRETGGWKWPAFMLTYMFALAWLAAFATYHAARALGA